jgi:hypothetical protein
VAVSLRPGAGKLGSQGGHAANGAQDPGSCGQLASSVEDLDDEQEGYEHRKGNQEHQIPAPFLLSGFDEVLFAFRAAELLSPGYGTAATKAMSVILNQDGTLTE